jgi:hypothetical protein
MTHDRILQIIKEEIAYENNLIFEGVNSYKPINGYRNNQLIEVYSNDGKQLINEGMIDTVQGVLDWAGFIPGIGDLLDGVNALIYMIRKKWFLGVTSLVAVVPVVGSAIAVPFKSAHKLLGKTANKLGNILGKIVSGGKGAATQLIDLLKSGGSKLKGVVDKIYSVVAKNASKINSFLDKVIPSFNNMIKNASFGYFSLPSSFIKSGDAIINQLKQFFTQLSKPSSYKVTKKAGKDTTKKELDKLVTNSTLSSADKKRYGPSYANADKKKYPTFEEFVKAAKEYENKKTKSVTRNYQTDNKGEYVPQSQRA